MTYIDDPTRTPAANAVAAAEMRAEQIRSRRVSWPTDAEIRSEARERMLRHTIENPSAADGRALLATHADLSRRIHETLHSQMRAARDVDLIRGGRRVVAAGEALRVLEPQRDAVRDEILARMNDQPANH